MRIISKKCTTWTENFVINLKIKGHEAITTRVFHQKQRAEIYCDRFSLSVIFQQMKIPCFFNSREIKYGYILLLYGCSCAVDEDNNALLVNLFKNAIKINENIQIVWSFFNSTTVLTSHSQAWMREWGGCQCNQI